MVSRKGGLCPRHCLTERVKRLAEFRWNENTSQEGGHLGSVRGPRSARRLLEFGTWLPDGLFDHTASRRRHAGVTRASRSERDA